MDLRDQLQQTLTGSYTLERELGGGGMSRVFVAHELRLQRKVVVKVLSPELAAGISAERFEREIQLAASLQQANIVPVLTAGDTEGLPYFTMPFVEGESLRVQLGKTGTISITEVISILRDVARALAYAHERGVVHRDIKPDNVLLSGGAAVVTDFGIAKALSASRTGSGSATLTQFGTSIGTPAYMAPEQAAGDPNIDHRADIYAFGCTAFELLAGRPPFTDRTPQRVLAAHMSEAPPLITDLRMDTPPALGQLVMACLAKDPDARPQQASELLRLLDTVTSGGSMSAMPQVLLGGRAMLRRALVIYAMAFVAVAVLARAAILVIGLPNWVFPGALIIMVLGLVPVLFTGYVQRTTMHALTATPALTPGGGARPQGTMATLAVKASPHVSWGRTARWGGYALGAFVAVVGLFMLLRALGIGPAGSLIGSGKLSNQDQILVADFKAAGADSASGGALAELMRASLQQSHAVRLMPASAVAGALARMQQPVDTRIDLAMAQEIARREGIKAIVVGEVTPLSGGSLISVKLLAAASGDVLWSATRSVGSAAEFVPAMDALARDLRAKIGESLRVVQGAPPLARVATASIEALQKFTEGARATDFENNDAKAIPLLDAAVVLDSSFGMAYRKLAIAISHNRTTPERIPVVLDKGLKHVDHLPEAERLAYMATYYWLHPTHADRAKAIPAFEELFRRFPEWKVIITSEILAALYASRHDFARADSLDLETMKLAPDEWLPYASIVEWQVNQGDLAAARQSVARMRARNPDDPVADQRAALLFHNLGDADSTRLLFSRLTRDSLAEWARYGHVGLQALNQTEGRLRDAGLERVALNALDAARGQAAPAALDVAADSAAVLLMVLDRPVEALRTVDDAVQHLGASRPASLDLVTVYAILGKIDRAKAELARYDATFTDTAARRVAANDREKASGWIAMAEGRTRDAVTAFRRSDSLPDGPATICTICLDVVIGQAFDRGGMADSAIAAFEHFVNTPNLDRISQDAYFLPSTLRRLGELYEAKGDKAKAALYYQKFVALWRSADPELQPKVTEIKRRLATLNDSPKTASTPKQ